MSTTRAQRTSRSVQLPVLRPRTVRIPSLPARKVHLPEVQPQPEHNVNKASKPLFVEETATDRLAQAVVLPRAAAGSTAAGSTAEPPASAERAVSPLATVSPPTKTERLVRKPKRPRLTRRHLLRSLAFVLSLTLATSGFCLATTTRVAEATDPVRTASAAANSGEPAKTSGKDEVVYTRLSANGAVADTYVVNHFLVNEAGRLTDAGAYQTVKNLTTTDTLDFSAQEISVPVDKGDFYYQGTLEQVQLPWIFAINYRLDGQAITPTELAGSSGELELQITTKANPAVNKLFYDNYVLQVQLTLNAGKAHNIIAPDATIASAGDNRQIAFTVLPGKDAELWLKAQVSGFEMPGIQISALPFSMSFDLPDTSAMEGDLTQLADAVALLDEGARELNSGVAAISGGADELSAGSAQFESGLKKLSGTSGLLNDSSKKIKSALELIAKNLAAGEIDPEQLKQMIAGLRQIALALSNGDQANPGIAQALAGVKGAFDAVLGAEVPPLPPGVESDMGALGTLLGDPGFQGLIGADNPAAINGAAAMTSILGTYPDYFGASQTWMRTAQGAYIDGDPAQNIPSVQATLVQLCEGSATMAEQLSTVAAGLEQALQSLDGLAALSAALGELSGSYAQFDSGLASYIAGVGALSDNYSQINAAMALLASGVGQLGDGSSALTEGTVALRANTSKMPQQVKDQIAEFMSSYRSADFTPVSFVSEQNADVSLVQFVLATDAIKIAKTKGTISDAINAADTEKDPLQAFLDRLKALFNL
ncbi:MAG: hypothetical protein LBP28_08855 [Coriobacteriales bacterium]|jgi:methyl-accepting chemotaxis protein|nr:hypothetical protein [Coriobacteriales bacterium]